VPVPEPDITSSFITALELVVEETEFGFCWEAPTANDCIIGEIVIIDHDRPEIGDFQRNRSMKRADLGVHREKGMSNQPQQ